MNKPRTSSSVTQKAESRLAWWNEVSPGVGLIAGYLVFGLYWILTPDTVVEVQTQTAVYEESVIGYVPEDRPHIRGVNIESLDRTKPVLMLFPKRRSNGSPVIHTENVTYRGKGEATIEVKHTEILRPKIASSELLVFRGLNPADEHQYQFGLNTVMEGTGYYLTQKTVSFDGATSGDIFAIRIATLFAGMAFLLFLLRVRHKVADYFKKLFTTPMQGDDPDGDW